VTGAPSAMVVMHRSKMSKRESSLRPLEEQFEPQLVKRIRAIQADLAELPLPDGAGKLYAIELRCSLEAGLLLASLHLATSFLELFVRDLLIYTQARDSPADNDTGAKMLLNNLEKRFEDSKRPQWSFSRMVDELAKQGTIDDSDAEGIKEYYTTIRVPIHHALTRRFLRGERESDFESDSFDFLENLFCGRALRWRHLEEKLEDEAIYLIARAVAFITSYAKYLAA
jgi:hypothetical protein